jgi:2'-5' RNA ligase
MNDKLVLSGILYMRVDDESINHAINLTKNAITEHTLIPLANEQIHITLINQKFLKGENKARLKSALASNNFLMPTIELEDKSDFIVRETKKAIIVRLKNQDEFKKAVANIMETAKINDYDKDRVFHISIANIDGSPYSSVGDVTWNDINTA